VLTIKGEKKEEKEKKKKDYYLSERRYGSFQRSFRVPNGINPDKIEPNFKNGVLTITLLKTPEAHHRQGRLKLLPIGMSVCRIRKRAARWSPRTQGRPEGRSIRVDIRWPIPGDTESMQRFAKELQLRPGLVLPAPGDYGLSFRA